MEKIYSETSEFDVTYCQNTKKIDNSLASVAQTESNQQTTMENIVDLRWRHQG